jgi:histidine ammonia-lyase
VSDAVELTGDDLTIEDVWDVAVDRRPVALGARGRDRAAAARAFLEAQMGDRTYGVNTGFGRLVSESIPAEQLAELQLRLLRSHACGVGEPYPEDVIRAAMLLRANTLAKGFSGVRVETIELLVDVLKAGIVPRVPSRGSVGASGDLAPLAHLALPLVGEGEAIVDGRLVSGAEALDTAGLAPITLTAKEGLSLINGTQFMTAMASLALVRAGRLVRAADVACALSLEALQGTAASLHPAIHAARPLRGQGRSAAVLRSLLADSAIIEAHRWCDKVQDAYSLRCAPQVHGASRDLLEHVEGTVTIELNAATDNPLVLTDDELIVTNGNFHGQPIAMALDCLAIACAELANISERRTERLVNPSLSEGLPPFLVARDEGLNSGFMMPQVVSAALVSENKTLCHPASIDSIPTSGGQEDHVSMGNAAGLKALQVVANTERVLAIELLAGAQAVEFLAPLAPGVGGRAARAYVRKLSERVRDDRPLSDDIERVATAIRDRSLLAAVERALGAPLP